jgi:hypothetical protein
MLADVAGHSNEAMDRVVDQIKDAIRHRDIPWKGLGEKRLARFRANSRVLDLLLGNNDDIAHNGVTFRRERFAFLCTGRGAFCALARFAANSKTALRLHNETLVSLATAMDTADRASTAQTYPKNLDKPVRRAQFASASICGITIRYRPAISVNACQVPSEMGMPSTRRRASFRHSGSPATRTSS